MVNSLTPNDRHRVSYSGWGWGGLTPGMNLTWGDIPPPINSSLFSSGFENLTSLSVILRHLEGELSILRCVNLNLIRGVISTSKKNFV
jgi:hypothetical protein